MAIENGESVGRAAVPGIGSGRCSASKRRGHLVLAAACAFVLAAAADPASGLSISDHPGFGDLYSKEFWSSASGSDVASAFRKDPEGLSYRSHILKVAVFSGAKADAIDALLRAGAPPNTRQDEGDRRTVLQEAVLLGTEAQGSYAGLSLYLTEPLTREEGGRRRAGIVSALLAGGADPRAVDATGASAIDLANRHGLEDVLPLLMSPRYRPPVCGRLCGEQFWKTADPGRVREAVARAGSARGRSSSGDTPLHVALKMAAGAEIVRALLDGGADPDARDARDDTPLHVAARTAGSAAAIGVLLERGAMVDVANARDRTPLHGAAEHATTIAEMRVLLEAGAGPDIRSGRTFGTTPRELAARQPEGPQATALMLGYGDRSRDLPGGRLDSLLLQAAVGHPETVTLLLDEGADARWVDLFGDTALHVAAAAGNTATARRLLQGGADPNWSKYDEVAIVSGDGERPLHMAVAFPEMVKLLLEHGADPNGRIPFTGETPLHLAADNCQGAVVALLLAWGANPNARDDYGDTPLVRAKIRLANSARQVEWETWRRQCENGEGWESPAQCRTMLRQQYEQEYEPRAECEENIGKLRRQSRRHNRHSRH